MTGSAHLCASEASCQGALTLVTETCMFTHICGCAAMLSHDSSEFKNKVFFIVCPQGSVILNLFSARSTPCSHDANVLKYVSGAMQLEAADDWEDELDDILTKFEEETRHRPLYDICFY